MKDCHSEERNDEELAVPGAQEVPCFARNGNPIVFRLLLLSKQMATN